LIEPLADTRGVEGWRVSADSELWLALISRVVRWSNSQVAKRSDYLTTRLSDSKTI